MLAAAEEAERVVAALSGAVRSTSRTSGVRQGARQGA